MPALGYADVCLAANENSPACPNGYAPLSASDQALLTRLNASQAVQRQSATATRLQDITGNEHSFCIYPQKSGFEAGRIHAGNPDNTAVSYNYECIMNQGTKSPVEGFHTHGGALSPVTSRADASVNVSAGTLGLISTNVGVIAGRRCK